MGVIAFKNRNASLRFVLKIFKEHFDSPELLRQYELQIKRAVYLDANPADTTWRSESLHQLALLSEARGKIEEARRFYLRALESFGEYEVLGLCRVMRDYALFVSRHEDVMRGVYYAEQALALHADDIKNNKGYRQRRLTESYVWRAKILAGGSEATIAKRELIRFALRGSQDCSIRDQYQIVNFALPYATGKNRQRLLARQLEIYAKRRKPLDALISLANLVIDLHIVAVDRLIRTILRKE